MQTIKLSAMGKKWLAALQNNTAIHEYCLKKYNKPPTFFLGVNFKKMPDMKYCPAVFLLLGAKEEGLENSEYHYGITVSWSIYQPDVIVDGVQQKWNENITGQVIEFLGVKEADDFGQLIYEALAEVNPNYPISKLDYNIDTSEHFPQWPGYMILTTQIYPAIGGDLIY